MAELPPPDPALLRVHDHLEQAQLALELYSGSDAAALRVLLNRTTEIARQLAWGTYADDGIDDDDDGRAGNKRTY